MRGSEREREPRLSIPPHARTNLTPYTKASKTSNRFVYSLLHEYSLSPSSFLRVGPRDLWLSACNWLAYVVVSDTWSKRLSHTSYEVACTSSTYIRSTTTKWAGPNTSRSFLHPRSYTNQRALRDSILIPRTEVHAKSIASGNLLVFGRIFDSRGYSAGAYSL